MTMLAGILTLMSLSVLPLAMLHSQAPAGNRLGVTIATGASRISSGRDFPEEATKTGSLGLSGMRFERDLHQRATLRIAGEFSARDTKAPKLAVFPTVLRLRTFDLSTGFATPVLDRSAYSVRIYGEVILSDIRGLDVLSSDGSEKLGSLPVRSREASVRSGMEVALHRRFPITFAGAYRHGLSRVSEPNRFRASSFEASISLFLLNWK